MDYVFSILILVGIYIVLAASFNLIIGRAGLASIAHPIFFALGAYTAALLAIHFGLNPVLATLAGAVVAAVFSLMISLPSLRISGDYLMITSIGFQLGLLQVIKNIEITGSQGGLSNIPTPIAGPERGAVFSIIALAAAAGTVLLIRWIVRGPYGRAINAMRDDELAFIALGRDATRIKIAIFAVGCGLAGVAGGIYAFYFQYLTPEQYEILASGTMLTMVVVGGMGSTWGPVVGALMLVALPQAITFLQLPPSYMAPVQGMIFTLLVILFLFLKPQGLVSPEPPAPLAHRRAGRV
ncbi:MAG: branched-chain amino acid ABC transporter permease [Betaproteobacteria bacterium]|nr:branched-chain amino acid ABC transporter permease [Betaproteobacteria bacterium]